jgi:uncharacterized protein HemY
MKKLLEIVVLGLLLSGNANARVIGIDQCIVDLGGFCIIETLIALLIVIFLLFFLGWPLKKWIKSHIEKKSKQNKKYRPGKLLLWVYGNAGIFVMFVISLVITFYFIN